MNQHEPGRNVYIGHRYVPLLIGEWDQSIAYEGLSIVTYQGASYTSKKRVPVGIDIENEEFWVLTGNYNAQVEYYRDEVGQVQEEIRDTKIDLEGQMNDTKTYVDDEVTESRNYVDGEVEVINSHLSQIALHYQSIGLNGDGTDTAETFNGILDNISKEGHPVRINLSDGIFNFDENIVVPKNISLVGNSALINYSGSFEFLGDQTVSGIIFDGGNHCGPLYIRDDNTVFKHNTIRNIKSNGDSEVTTALSIRTVNDSDIFNVDVYKNEFDSIYPLEEDGREGNNLGMVKAVFSFNPNDVKIHKNTFKNLNGHEDGDYVHFMSNYQTNLPFPFKANGRGRNVNGTSIIDNTFYLGECKSGIKLEVGGVVVENNKFYSLPSEYRTLSAFRAHNTGDIIVKGNTIITKENSLQLPLYADFVENVTFTDNIVIDEKPTKVAEYYVVHVAEAKNVTIVNTNASVYNRVGAVSLRNVEDAIVENNSFIMSYTDEDTRNFCYMLNSWRGSELHYVDNLTFTNNSLKVISNQNIDVKLELQSFKNSIIGNVNTNGNVIKTIVDVNYQTENLKIDGVDSTKPVYFNVDELSTDTEKYINDLVITNSRCDDVYLKRVNNISIFNVNGFEDQNVLFKVYSTNNLSVENSNFHGNYTNIFRIHTPDCTEIRSVSNNIRHGTEFYNTYNNDTFDKKELTYISGQRPVNKMDYGTTSQRPDVYRLLPSHQYFDTSLNQTITWSGQDWFDGNGIDV